MFVYDRITGIEFYIDNIFIAADSDKIEVTMHTHSSGNGLKNDRIVEVMELIHRKAFITFSSIRQVEGLHAKKKDMPGNTGGENLK